MFNLGGRGGARGGFGEKLISLLELNSELYICLLFKAVVEGQEAVDLEVVGAARDGKNHQTDILCI